MLKLETSCYCPRYSIFPTNILKQTILWLIQFLVWKSYTKLHLSTDYQISVNKIVHTKIVCRFWSSSSLAYFLAVSRHIFVFIFYFNEIKAKSTYFTLTVQILQTNGTLKNCIIAFLSKSLQLLVFFWLLGKRIMIAIHLILSYILLSYALPRLSYSKYFPQYLFY